MSDIGDQDARSTRDRRVDDEIERSDDDIEDDRKYWDMHIDRTSSLVYMWEYPPSTPDIENIADRECEECDHSKEDRRYPTPEWEAAEREKCEYQNSDGRKKSNHDSHEEHHTDTDEINSRWTEELFGRDGYIWECIRIFGHSMRWRVDKHQ